MTPLVQRTLASRVQNAKRGVLLLGPRQTGKSTLIRSLRPDLSINLMQEQQYLQFARNPSELQERVAESRPRTIFIDEVQRLPGLLNSIQVLIDEGPKGLRFLLTGSSARKLRRGQANLLPGRIIHFELGPLTLGEIGYDADVRRMLAYGSLPGIWTENDRQEREDVLNTYAATYVKEEIQAEALTRNLEGFSRFIFAIAARATLPLDFSKLASQAAITRASAIRFVEILEDTLLVFRVEPFTRQRVRRIVQHPRIFFFDNGVLNGLLGSFGVSEDRIGMLFENLVASQLYHAAHAHGVSLRISSYRTEHGAEVDLIVERDGKVWAVELKASRNVGPSDLTGLKSFAEYFGEKHEAVVAYLGTTERKIGNVHVLPWWRVVKELG
jgi:uncharacterized protein